MTKLKGRYVAKPAGAAAKTPKALKTGAALFATERRKLEKQQAAMVQEGITLEDRRAEAVAAVAASGALLASAAAANAALAAREAAVNARERELFGQPLEGAKQDARAANAAEQWRALRHKPGGLLDESQSRAILLLYFHLVETRKSREKSVEEVATVFGISKDKVYAVRTRWDTEKALLTSSAIGRGVARGEDGRRVVDDEQRAKLCKYITEQRENGKKVGRRTVAQWLQTETGRAVSDCSAGNLLSRLGYKYRNGTYCTV